MADVKDLVDLLTRGGPAEAIQSGLAGYQQGQATVRADQALDLEKRKAAFQQKLQEAGLFDPTELGDLPKQAGLNLAPGRSVTEDFVKSLPGLKGQAKPKSAFEEPASPQEIEMAQGAINSARQSLGLEPVDLTKFAGSRQALKDLTNQNLRSTGISASSPELSGQRAAAATAQKAFVTQKADAGKAMNALTQLRTSAKLLGDFESGVFNQLKAKGVVELGKVQADPSVIKALGLVKQNLGSLARGPFAERGVLTDDDIKRVEDGLGNPTLPLRTKLDLVNALEGKMMLDNAVAAEIAGDDKGAAIYRRKAKQLLKAFDNSEDPIGDILGGQSNSPQAVPQVGQTFNGGKVLKVTRVQ